MAPLLAGRRQLWRPGLALLLLLCAGPVASEEAEEGTSSHACRLLEDDISLLQVSHVLSKQHPPRPPPAASELQQPSPRAAAAPSWRSKQHPPRPPPATSEFKQLSPGAGPAPSWPSGKRKSDIRLYLESKSGAITRRPYALAFFTVWLVVVACWALCSLVEWQQPDAQESGHLLCSLVRGSAKPRDTTLDETKFHLMTLVIFGHFLSQWRVGGDASALVWGTVDAVHMPAFTLLCGFFWKPLPPSAEAGAAQPGASYRAEARLWQTCVNLLGGFLVAGWLLRAFWWFVAALDGVQTPWYTQLKDVFGKVYLSADSPDSPLSPWFLIALFWWRMVWSPVSTVLHRRARLPAAVLAAWTFQGPPWSQEARSTVGGTLGLGRCFRLLPFYELGAQLSRRDLAAFSTAPAALAGIVLVFGVLPTCLWHPWPLVHDAIHLAGPGTVPGYLGMFVVTLSALGILLRGAQLGAETDLGKTIHAGLAASGTRTLYAYVLQWFVTVPIGTIVDFRPALNGLGEPLSIVLLLTLAVAFNAMLSSHFSERMFWWVCQPSYLFGPKPSAPKSRPAA